MRQSSQTPSVAIELAENGVALLCIQRPEKFNALDSETIQGLSTAFATLAQEDSLRAVILTGSGTAFCAGGDLQEVMEISADPQWKPRMRKLMASAADLVLQMRSLPQPIIAAVNGPAVGGGMALAVASDIRLCADSAYFSTAYISLGLVGFEMGLSVLLPSAIGSGAAFDLAISGGRLNAQQAERLNLVREVVPTDDLLARARKLADGIASRSAHAVRSTKEMMNNHISLERLRQVLQAELEAQMLCVLSDENRAAIAKLARTTAR